MIVNDDGYCKCPFACDVHIQCPECSNFITIYTDNTAFCKRCQKHRQIADPENLPSGLAHAKLEEQSGEEGEK
jgi:uncharacterized paraquat-inducible protein A